MTLILGISFLIHAVSLYLILLLYVRISKIHEVEKKQGKLLDEMETVVTGYLMEMKEENEQFLNRLNKVKVEDKQNISHTIDKQKVRSQKNVNVVEKISNADMKDLLPNYSKKITSPTKNVNPEPTMKKQDEQNPEEIARNLLNEGYTIDEIAKELKIGITEIELMLKFQQK